MIKIGENESKVYIGDTEIKSIAIGSNTVAELVPNVYFINGDTQSNTGTLFNIDTSSVSTTYPRLYFYGGGDVRIDWTYSYGIIKSNCNSNFRITAFDGNSNYFDSANKGNNYEGVNAVSTTTYNAYPTYTTIKNLPVGQHYMSFEFQVYRCSCTWTGTISKA